MLTSSGHLNQTITSPEVVFVFRQSLRSLPFHPISRQQGAYALCAMGR